MMIRKIVSGLLALVISASAIPVFAADTGVPDLIITDIRISNPNYKVGDIVSFEYDIKNVGTAAMKLGWFAMQNQTGITPLVNGGTWTRPRIFPGQTITTTLTDFKVTQSNISVTMRCNSSSIAVETNRSNNTLTKSFSPSSVSKNLVIKDARLSETNISDGNVATFEIDYENAGISDIPQSDIDIKLTVL